MTCGALRISEGSCAWCFEGSAVRRSASGVQPAAICGEWCVLLRRLLASYERRESRRARLLGDGAGAALLRRLSLTPAGVRVAAIDLSNQVVEHLENERSRSSRRRREKNSTAPSHSPSKKRPHRWIRRLKDADGVTLLASREQTTNRFATISDSNVGQRSFSFLDV